MFLPLSVSDSETTVYTTPDETTTTWDLEDLQPETDYTVSIVGTKTQDDLTTRSENQTATFSTRKSMRNP